MNLQQIYNQLKEELKSNPLIIKDEQFNYNINEVRNALIEDYKDFLYSHIEWEHIEQDAQTNNLDLLSFNQLEKLAIDYDY
jgi:hypothetical protein